jgi:hypothetical protein
MGNSPQPFRFALARRARPSAFLVLRRELACDVSLEEAAQPASSPAPVVSISRLPVLPRGVLLDGNVHLHPGTRAPQALGTCESVAFELTFVVLVLAGGAPLRPLRGCAAEVFAVVEGNRIHERPNIHTLCQRTFFGCGCVRSAARWRRFRSRSAHARARSDAVWPHHAPVSCRFPRGRRRPQRARNDIRARRSKRVVIEGRPMFADMCPCGCTVPRTLRTLQLA